MSGRPLVAGVDSSTQSCKVLVCDAETGEVVRTGRAAHPDGTSVDPRHWWDAWVSATAGGLLDGVTALSVGGQQHGMVTLDEQGDLVRNALLWNDTRSADAAADLVADLGGGDAWAAATGVVPVAAVTIAKVRWLAGAEPDNLARTRTIVLPHDWLTGQILRAGGGFREWTTDRGDASGTGYWSAHSQTYRPDLMTLAAGREFDVPQVLAPNEAAGVTDGGVVVGPGTGDNMGAALGLGLRPGDVVISLGTSGTAFARHDRAIADGSGEIQSFADAAGGYLPLMCTLNAARVLVAGAAMLGVDLAGLDRLALAAPAGADGLTLLPYLDGERTPNLPSATGTLSGLTRGNATPENLARAVLEGMLLNVASGIDSLRREGVEVQRVLLIGGAAASTAVRAIAPAFFGAPVVRPAAGEYVALGAARQAAWTLCGPGTDLPEWPVTLEPGSVSEPGVDASRGEPAGEIKDRYAALLATVHGHR